MQIPILKVTDFMPALKMQISKTGQSVCRIRKTHIFIRIWTKTALKSRAVRLKNLRLRGHFIRTRPLLFSTSRQPHSTRLPKTRFIPVSTRLFKAKPQFIFRTGFQAVCSAIKSPCLTSQGLLKAARIGNFWQQAKSILNFGTRRQNIMLIDIYINKKAQCHALCF